VVRIQRNRQLGTSSQPSARPVVVSLRHKKRVGKFMLMIGDDGAILTYLQRGLVVKRLFAVSPAPEHTEALRALLDSDDRAPITILLDSLDQSYQRQTLPPVAKVSLNKIIKRRLERDFAADDIKGALEIGREKTGRKDWNYLLVAVANNGTLPQWVDICLDRDNPFKGILLSPVECEPLIRGLAAHVGMNEDSAAKAVGIAVEQAAQSADSQNEAMSGEHAAASKKSRAKQKKIAIKTNKKASAIPTWQMLITHHKVGGFRLVALQEGKLTFTRITQPIGDSSPAIIAGSVEQEAMNTIEYMRRIGYNEGEPLDVFVIVSDEIRAAIDPRNIPARSHHFFTPHEAAVALKIEGAAQPEDHYGDVLLSAFSQSQRRHRIVLHPPGTAQLAGLHMGSFGLRATAMIACFALTLYGAQTAMDAYEIERSISKLNGALEVERGEFAAAKAIMDKFPKHLPLMLDVWRIYSYYAKAQIHFPQTVFRRVFETSGPFVAFSEFDWERTIAAAANGAPIDPSTARVALKVYAEYIKQPEDTITSLKQKLSDLLALNAKSLADYDVSYVNLPEIFSEKSELKTSIGGGSDSDAIRKVLQEPLLIQMQAVAPKNMNPSAAGGM
jgi:ribosomal protein L39E